MFQARSVVLIVYVEDNVMTRQQTGTSIDGSMVLCRLLVPRLEGNIYGSYRMGTGFSRREHIMCVKMNLALPSHLCPGTSGEKAPLGLRRQDVVNRLAD